MGKTIAVMGASGFVGRHIVKELVSRGHAVRGLVRDREKARSVLPRDPRVELVVGECTEGAALGSLVRGCDGAINAVGIIREVRGQTFQKIHVESMRELVGSCRAEGVERVVLISALGVWDEGPAGYQKSKAEGEAILRRSDRRWTILRPSIVHGVGSDFLRMAKGWVSGDSPPWFFMPYFTRGVPTSGVPLAGLKREDPKVQPVSVEDVAWAAAECLEREQCEGEVYNLVGPEVLTWPQMLRVIRDTLPDGNATLEPVGVPSELAAAQAWAARQVGLGGLLPFDQGMAQMGALDSTAELAKVKAHLGLEPRPFAATLKTYASQV